MGDIEKKKEDLIKQLTPEQIRLQPFYYDLRNRIINPRSFIQETRYFWTNWKPLLGPVLTVLIMELRSRCYMNLKTGETRNFCSPTYEKIGAACGISVATVKRHLCRSYIKSNKYLSLFLDVKPQYIYNENLKKKVKASNIYKVAMDDPLIPKDEGTLAVLAAEKLLENHSKRKNDLKVEMTSRSKLVVDNSPPTGQNDLYIYRDKNDPANVKDTLYSTTNVNNVNKTQVSNERILNSESKIKCLVEDMVIQLEDDHSTGFFKRVAELCPENFIYRALSEVKEEASMGKIKKSKGAYFTSKIMRMAKEAGINLRKNK